MRLCEFDDSNNNSNYVIELLTNAQKKISDNYWLVSDLDMVPIFLGDYSGTGQIEKENVAYEFQLKMEKERISILTFNRLIEILKATRTIYNGVFMCFPNNVFIDKASFRPVVEAKNPNDMSHKDAIYEIRILDGDLFYIFDEQIN